MITQKKQPQKITLAVDLMKIICIMAEQGEDYSLIQRTYNDSIEEYSLPLRKIKWISNFDFEFVDN